MKRNCKAVQQGQHHLLSRKLDKGSSNKPLCVNRMCSWGEILLRSLKKKKKKKKKILKNFFLLLNKLLLFFFFLGSLYNLKQIKGIS